MTIIIMKLPISLVVMVRSSISSEVRACHQHQILFGTTNSLHFYDLVLLIVTIQMMMMMITMIQMIMTMVMMIIIMMIRMMMLMKNSLNNDSDYDVAVTMQNRLLSYP